MSKTNKKHSKIPGLVKIIAVMLLLLALAVGLTPTILSTTFVRNIALAQINASPDMQVEIKNWDITWRNGALITGINVDLPDTGFNITADSASLEMSIPKAIKLGLALNKAMKKPVSNCNVNGYIKLKNGKITVSSLDDETVAMENINVLLTVKPLAEIWPFEFTGIQQENNGQISLTGGLALLNKDMFNPEQISGNIAMEIANIDLFNTLAVLNTNQTMPDVQGLLNGTLEAERDRRNLIQALGSLSLGPIEISDMTGVDETTVFAPLNLTLDVSGKQQNININKISLESDFTQISIDGNVSLNESNKPGAVNMNITGMLDTDKLTIFAGNTFLGWNPVPDLFRGGLINIETELRTDLSQPENTLENTFVTGSLSLTNINLGVISQIPSNVPEQPKADCIADGHLNFDIAGIEQIQTEGYITLGKIQLDIPGIGKKRFNPLKIVLDIKGHDREITIKELTLDSGILSLVVSGLGKLEKSGALKNFTSEITGEINLANIAETVAFAAKLTPDENSRPEDWGTFDFKSEIKYEPDNTTNLIENLNVSLAARLRDMHFYPLVKLADQKGELPFINGALNANIDIAMQGIEKITAQITSEAPGIFMSGGFFDTDKPAIRDLKISADTTLAGKNINIKSISLTSSLLHTEASGSIQLTENHAPDAINITHSATLDIPETIRQFPATLGVKEGLTFTSGTLAVQSGVRSQADGFALDSNISIDKLAIEHDGKTAGLSEPVLLTAKAFIGKEPRIDELIINSSFLSGKAAGDLRDFTAEFKADIESAIKEADKFIDLAGKSGKGTITLALTSSGVTKESFNIKTSGNIKNLNLTGFSETPTAMPVMDIAGRMTLNTTPEGKLRDITDFMLTVSSDLLSLKLTNKRFIPGALENTVMDDMIISAESNLEKLTAFISNIADTPEGLSVKGDAKFLGTCNIVDGVLSISNVKATLDPFAMRTKDGLTVENGIIATGNLQTAITGAFDTALITANMALDAGRIRHFGVEITDVKVPAKMADAQIDLRVTSKANEGTVDLPVNIDMSITPWRLTIPDNTMALSKFKLTDPMLNELLGMAAPILRGCVVTSGSISFRVNRCRIALNEAGKQNMEVSTDAIFNSVVLAPAGLMLDILDLVGMAERSITIPDHSISTVFRNNRFYSSPMNIRVGPHLLLISGSVGLDETLDYQAQIPLTRELVGKQAFQYVQGQSVILPISGTVSSPAIDKKKFLAEIARLAASAAVSEKGQEILDKGVQEGIKALEDLFK